MHRSRPLVFSALAFGSAAAAQHDVAPSAPPTALTIAPASREGQDQIATFALAPGLACDLVAAEPDLCNPVAFAIDGMGRIYVVETFRINDGVFDTRSYMQWKDRDLACLTVADRLAKYRDFIPNDIPKFAAIPERVRLLVDTDKNGTLDRSTVFADQFSDLADGVAAGVLPVDDDVFFTNIPKLRRLRGHRSNACRSGHLPSLLACIAPPIPPTPRSPQRVGTAAVGLVARSAVVSPVDS